MHKYLRNVQEGDLEYLAENLRQADIEEITADGASVLEALVESVELSYFVQIIDHSGVPSGILGLASYSDEVDSLWMVATDDINSIPMTFLKNSKRVISELFRISGKLRFANYTYAKNTLHHKWLKWCGAHIGDMPIEVGPQKREFLSFVIERY